MVIVPMATRPKKRKSSTVSNSSVRVRRPRITAATRRRVKIRKEFWPKVGAGDLWDRKSFKGFTTIPRTLPIIMRIIDGLDNKTAGRAYIHLWSLSFDDYVIEIRDESEAAYHAGYTGQRAIRTWRERIDVLEEFGFVRVQKGPNGTYNYILLLEPHVVVEELRKGKLVDDNDYNAFRTQLINIGAT